MASFSPSATTTVHTTMDSLKQPPFLHRTPKYSSFAHRTSKRVISCKASNNEDLQIFQNPNDTTKYTPPILDRRNMLLGLGGLYGSGLTLGLGQGMANAAPMAPDVSNCTLTDAQWDGSAGDQCCPPKLTQEIKEFKFEDYPNPTTPRIRRPAHAVLNDPELLHDYKRAIGLMRTGLPMVDPRCLWQQAKVHCAYCDAAYPQLGHPDKRLEVHNSWLFASFHRWYIYFFERIMAKLINKPDFAIPFWNWDHPDGMYMPEIFKDVDSPLYDPNRNTDHLNSVIDLSYSRSAGDRTISDADLIQDNLVLMKKQMLYATKPSVFFGNEYHLGDDADRKNGAGYLERSPHNIVHVWTGSKTVRGKQDMGALWSAGRDPMFYCHHANVDRMWHIWRNELPGRSRVDINKDDYLNAWFVFYDENAEPVKCYVKDSLDIEKLGYTYEQVELPWLGRKVTPKSAALTRSAPILSASTTEAVSFPKPLDSVIKTKVARPTKKRSKQEKEDQEEVLVVDLEMSHADEFIKFDVYVNDVEEQNPEERTKVTAQLAGSYTALPHKEKHKTGKKDIKGKDEKIRKSTLTLALNTLLEEIGAEEDESLIVSLVPRSGTEAVDITDVRIEFASD